MEEIRREKLESEKAATSGKWLFRAALVGSVALLLAAGGCLAPKGSPDLPLVAEAWNTIQKQYVDRSAIEPKDLTYGAISGMVDALGDTGHSSFLTPEMVKELKRMERGEFKGVGIEIQSKDGNIVVVSPMDGSPAQKAGVHPGDIILKVSGQDITDWSLAKVVEKIGGRPGTKVALTLLDPHTNRERDVTLVRASIKLHEVTWRPLPGTSMAHLRLATFDAGVDRDLRKALLEIKDAGLKGIILDLRNNPGGLLDEAVSVASEFLQNGNVLLSKDVKGNVQPVPVEKGGIAPKIPLIVLVNEGSASAAEIVAGALQDSGRAKLLGEKTFGTGTVLEEFRLSDGSALLLAVQEWLTPAGHSFWHKGIKPDFDLALAQDADPLFPVEEKSMTPQEIEQTQDRQLLKARDLLAQQLPGGATNLVEATKAWRRPEQKPASARQ